MVGELHWLKILFILGKFSTQDINGLKALGWFILSLFVFLEAWSSSTCIAQCVAETSQSYRKISNIRRAKSKNLCDCRHVLQLPLANPLKPCVKLRMKM